MMMLKRQFFVKPSSFLLIPIGLLWLLVQLPYPVFMRLGKCLGWLASFVPHYARTITKINLGLAFPALSQSERTALLRKNYMSLGMSVLETAFAWFAPARRLEGLVEVAHEEVLSVREEHGVLVVLTHMHTLQIMIRLCARRYQGISAVYRPHRKAVIERFNIRHLSSQLDEVIPRSDVRAMVRALRRKDMLMFLPDIDAGRDHSIFAPFFGVDTASVASVSKLTRLGKAKLVPLALIRKPDLSGYELRFGEVLQNYPSDEVLYDVTVVNAVMEAMIREHPDQYLWQYRRFNTRPEGELPFYPRKRKKSRKRMP